jgi:hypothetical protein
MSRYIRDEAIGKPADFVDFIMSDFLQKYGFTLVNINGETVYQKGKGFLEMPQYFSYRYMNGVIHIEAWVKFAWLPGVYGKENDMSGFVGAIPKNTYRESIEELIRVLYQPLPDNRQNPNGGMNNGMMNGGMPNGYGQPAANGGGQPMPGMMNNGMPNGYGQPVQGMMNGGMANGYGQQAQGGMPNGYNQPAAGGPITVKGVDMQKRASTGFKMSVAGAAFLTLAVSFFYVLDKEFNYSVNIMWVCGMLYAGLGAGYCYRGMSSSKRGLATAGFAMSIIELIVGILIIVMLI